MLIVALGTAFFVGIKATAPDMLQNAKSYLKQYNLCDIRIQSSIGFTDTDISALKKIEGVQYVSGGKFADAFVFVNGEAQLDIDGTSITARAYSISPDDIKEFTHGVNDGEYMNRVQLIEGRYPRKMNECLVDASRLSTPESFRLGSIITLKNGGNEQLEELNETDFTVVGVIRTPLYLSFERGNTNIGSGKLGTFIIVPEEAFNTDYFTEVYLKIQGADGLEPFSDEYFAYMSEYLQKIKDASPRLIAARVDELRPQLDQKIADAEKQIADAESEVNVGLAELDATIATLRPLAENGDRLIADAEKEFNDRYAQVEDILSNSSTAYQEALAEFYRKKQALTEKQSEYDTKQLELQSAKEQYDSLKNQYTDASARIESTKKQIESTKSMINAASDLLAKLDDTQIEAYSNDQIQSVIALMQGTYPDLYFAIRSLTATGLAGEVVKNIEPYLDQQKTELAKEEADLATYTEIINALGTSLSVEEQRLKDATVESQNAYKLLQQASADLDNYSQALSKQGYDIQTSTVELAISKMQAQQQLEDLKSKIKAAPAQLNEALTKRDEIKAQSESSLAFARSELENAKELRAQLSKVNWNVYNRESTPGYTSYGQSVNNVEVLSNIFPIFFFIISSLVCLTTVTRLVEEDRTLLGTYKALGYTSNAIMTKYVIYALSACVFGSALGIGTGVYLFPYVINATYSIMYSLPKLTYSFPYFYAAIGFGIALLSTGVVTWFAAIRDLRLKPSVLMRPKVPKRGKRILLEHIGFFWRRLSFTAKVTARNLFRNKSRFSMTLVGVAGCTALLLASLGFYNSISAIKAKQFDGDNAITRYDLQVVFDNPQTTPVHTAEYNSVSGDGRLAGMTLISMKSMTGFSAVSDVRLDVYVFVPEEPIKMPMFISLRDRTTKEEIDLDGSGAVITEKLAKDTGVDVGGQICFEDAAGNVYTVRVSAISENYTFHYIYLTPDVYRSTVGSDPVYNYAIGNIADSIKTSKQTDLEHLKGVLAGDLMKIEGVTTVAYLSETTRSVGEITNALSLVILLFFVTALILAFVVLYNLANINIIERTRELATLKVLGFTENEVNRYILRENMIVSIFGIGFGIGLGILLHRLLIRYTAIDTVMYGQQIYWYSYLLAVGITALFIAGVNLILRRKTQRIDMVESLKSVE